MNDDRPATRSGRAAAAIAEGLVMVLFLPANIWIWTTIAKGMVDLGLLDLGWLAVAIGTCGGK